MVPYFLTRMIRKIKLLNTIGKFMPNLGLKKAYHKRGREFLEKDIRVKDPFDLFNKWFEEASNNPGIIEPNAMCLSTATRDGFPSARIMLCKGFGRDGFQFYTHYSSRKGQELEENPEAALTFFWEPLSKVVRIEGCVRKLPISCADEYFKSRPYPSQIGSLSSDQSKAVESRDCLVKISGELMETYKEGEVPRPDCWGGYTVIPRSMEFWQGQTDRIHDRIRFRQPNECESPDYFLSHPGEGCWIYERLQP